jgi:hypothetical protein
MYGFVEDFFTLTQTHTMSSLFLFDETPPGIAYV